ncbi:Crp/Fnr family transcriptional regulator [bacterium]|nr:MAG: Crp/Fnr family transcriptional regulator [bacterium]
MQPAPTGRTSTLVGMGDKLGFMRRLNLFEQMSEAEVEQISRELKMRHCRAHETVFEGTPDRVYLLKAGHVRLYRLSSEGEDVTTAMLEPGQLFGLSALFGGGNEDLSAEALDDIYVCEAGAPDFLAILARHPLLMAKVMMAMAKQMFRLERTIEGLAREPVDSRLARLVVDMLGAAERLPEGQLLPVLGREEMAKIAITTRESVSRTLSAWSKKGIVELRGRRILVRDPERLRRLIHISDD